MEYLIWKALFVAALALLITVSFDPDITTDPMRFVAPRDAGGTVTKVKSLERLTFSVEVEGEKLHCWLFLPEAQSKSKTPPPVVVAAYGLGVQKDIALIPFATNLAARGLSVVLFDYRHWGVSGGFPRHVADPQKEVQDVISILEHLQNTNGLERKVDTNRIALYGASLGGGVMLTVASQLSQKKHPMEPSVKAVVAAVPFVSGKDTQAAARADFVERIRVIWAVMQDMFWSYLKKESVVYIRLAKSEESKGVSAMRLNKNEYDIWASRTPLMGKAVDGAWENRLAARTLYNISRFQADDSAVAFLDIPTLVIAGTYDNICPIEPIRRMVQQHAGKKSRKELVLKEFPIHHFEFLTAEHFPVLVETTVSFLKDHI
ncbi:hypothetical protein cyc_07815 [Cyclospora cayetanensis]|uniref:Serine aminopeptidase S33 domain-containing protein n=1 Tax=Cyclospora cayetanensis TaxID=88456 RepID=A0A1D3CUV3_9EIME|nr:hypothetical protein cyc_07815 [Cyclospora cayetanensis]